MGNDDGFFPCNALREHLLVAKVVGLGMNRSLSISATNLGHNVVDVHSL